jgi:uncharacterized protein YndB with AHSA1/START domain
MRATTPAPETIRKEVRVEAPPATAYRVFTQDMSGWWPFASHSVYGSESTEALLEAAPGGRWFERTPDGRESVWGTVVEADPPVRLLMTFHPGRRPEDAEPMHVEIRFTRDGTGTLVTLEHHGWQNCSPEQLAEFEGYEQGWEFVLGRYGHAVAA